VKTRMTRLLTKAMCLLLCVFVWPSAAYAFEPVDLSHPVSLTIYANDEDIPLAGVGFELYRVADLNEYAQFELLPMYSGFSGDINKLENAGEWVAAAEEFKMLAADAIPDAAETSREDGLATFDYLTPGLYLVTGAPVEILPWTYTFTPFMVSIPTRDVNDEWLYDVFSDVKLEKLPALIDIDVVKIWDDEGHESDRPNTIYVDLYCDGEPIDVAMLYPGNSWSHTFTGLSAAHEYTVKEREVLHWYTVTYEVVNGVLVIRNTHRTDGTPVPDIPATGQLWWPVPVLAGVGMLLLIAGWYIQRKWSQEHE